MENPIKTDDLGENPLFPETSILVLTKLLFLAKILYSASLGKYADTASVADVDLFHTGPVAKGWMSWQKGWWETHQTHHIPPVFNMTSFIKHYTMTSFFSCHVKAGGLKIDEGFILWKMHGWFGLILVGWIPGGGWIYCRMVSPCSPYNENYHIKGALIVCINKKWCKH